MFKIADDKQWRATDRFFLQVFATAVQYAIELEKTGQKLDWDQFDKVYDEYAKNKSASFIAAAPAPVASRSRMST